MTPRKKPQAWPFQYAVVAIDLLFVEPGYQRPTLQSFIAWIVEHFEERLVLTLVVSQRPDGRYAILDGQQRWMTLKKLGYTHVPALIYTGLTYEQEAQTFAVLNFERKNMQPWFLYRALREAKDEAVLAVDEIVEAADFVVGHSIEPDSMIGSPHTLLAIYEGDADVVRSGALDGPEVLRRTLETVAGAWRGSALSWKQAKTSAMLRGLSRWLSVNPTVPADALARVLRMVEPSTLQQQAKQLQEGGAGSGKGRKMEQAIEILYARHGDRSLRSVA